MSGSLSPRLVGGILIGGASRRFGAPKALAELAGEAFASRVARALRTVVDELVLLGEGAAPPGLSELRRIADAPGCGGPLAGVLGFLRVRPQDGLLVAACDQALLEPEALRWLVARRSGDAVAVVARWSSAGIEPTPAIYEPACRPVLERLVTGAGSLQPLAQERGVAVGRPPAELARSWTSIDTVEQLRRIRIEAGD